MLTYEIKNKSSIKFFNKTGKDSQGTEQDFFIDSKPMPKRFPNSVLIIYPDSRHGGIFQNQDVFAKQALAFISK